MIVSHKHRFIFVKTVKTAGTSIEVDLSQHVGPDDIVTPFGLAEVGHQPRNFVVNGKRLRGHAKARDVRALLGPEIFDSYYKFCVEREPVDKCISHYSMKKNSPRHNLKWPDMTFDQYVAEGNFPVNRGKYTDKDGRVIVDRILRYETLAEELAEVCRHLGFNCNLKARAKSNWRADIEVTPDQASEIYRVFSASNEITGYSLHDWLQKHATQAFA